MRFRSLVSHVICRYCSARQKFSLGHPSEMLDQVRQICRANHRKLVCIARNGEKQTNTRNGRKTHAKEKMEAKEIGCSNGVVYSLLDKGETRARQALEVLNDFLKL